MRRVGTDARPAAESATAGVVWRGRSIRSCVFASCPLGAGGSRQRVDGAPRPPGSVRSGSQPGVSANTDRCAGGPRVRFPVSRVLISWKGGTPGCGVRADRARGSGTQAHPVDGRGRARTRHVRRRDPAPHRDLSVRIHTGQSQLVRRRVDADRARFAATLKRIQQIDKGQSTGSALRVMLIRIYGDPLKVSQFNQG